MRLHWPWRRKVRAGAGNDGYSVIELVYDTADEAKQAAYRVTMADGRMVIGTQRPDGKWELTFPQ